MRLAFVTLGLLTITAGNPIHAQDDPERSRPDTAALHEIGSWLSSRLPSLGSFDHRYEGRTYIEVRISGASLEVNADLMNVARQSGTASLLPRSCVLNLEGTYRVLNFDGSTARSAELTGAYPIGGMDPASIEVQRWQPIQAEEYLPGSQGLPRWQVSGVGAPIWIDKRANAEQVADKLRQALELCGGE